MSKRKEAFFFFKWKTTTWSFNLSLGKRCMNNWELVGFVSKGLKRNRMECFCARFHWTPLLIPIGSEDFPNHFPRELSSDSWGLSSALVACLYVDACSLHAELIHHFVLRNSFPTGRETHCEIAHGDDTFVLPCFVVLRFKSKAIQAERMPGSVCEAKQRGGANASLWAFTFSASWLNSLPLPSDCCAWCAAVQVSSNYSRTQWEVPVGSFLLSCRCWMAAHVQQKRRNVLPLALQRVMLFTE